MPGVILFAVLPFHVYDGARRFGFEHRVHRWQNGEHQGLEEDDGLNAEPAKIPRLLRRDTLHSSKLCAAGGASQGAFVSDSRLARGRFAGQVKRAGSRNCPREGQAVHPQSSGVGAVGGRRVHNGRQRAVSMSIRGGGAAAATAIMLGIMAASTLASAHLSLKESSPEKDATVTTSPGTVTLWFTEAPQMAGTSVRLLPKGGEPLDLEPATAKEDDPSVVVLEVSETLADGDYEVMWRAMAQDGHTIRGDFGFTVQTAR